MIADAHDESFILTRLADKDDWTPAELNAALTQRLGLYN